MDGACGTKEDMTNAYKILPNKSEGKRPYLGTYARIILTWISERKGVMMLTGFI
jgi:hypothetical protein